MVTLTPKSDNQVVVAIRSGLGKEEYRTAEDMGEYFARLVEGVEEELPPIKETMFWTAKDPVRAAEYFEDIVECFLRDILGWDQETRKSRKGGGEYGTALAYAGGIENQGNGLLHTHLLIWLDDMAPTVEAALKEKDRYTKGLSEFIDSIASTNLPIFKICAIPINEEFLFDDAELNDTDMTLDDAEISDSDIMTPLDDAEIDDVFIFDDAKINDTDIVTMTVDTVLSDNAGGSAGSSC